MATREIELIKAGFTYRFTESTVHRANHRIKQLVQNGEWKDVREIATNKTVDGYAVYTRLRTTSDLKAK